MSNQDRAAQGSAATAQSTLRFKQMNWGQKSLHIIKVALFFVTFGFAFANILHDD